MQITKQHPSSTDVLCRLHVLPLDQLLKRLCILRNCSDVDFHLGGIPHAFFGLQHSFIHSINTSQSICCVAATISAGKLTMNKVLRVLALVEFHSFGREADIQ